VAQIRVLVVDDSAFMRHAVGRLIDESGDLVVVGTAANGEEGLRQAAALKPDVITLDVEMPVLDGPGMLRRLMADNPIRVVMLSSLTTEGAAVTLDALDAGAIDFVAKPGGSLSIDVGKVGRDLVEKVRAAAGMSAGAFLAHRHRTARHAAARPAPQAPTTPARPVRTGGVSSRRLVVIASSTGGPGALNAVVPRLSPSLGAGVLIVQHMPPGFTASLAGRLGAVGQIPCHEAAANDLIVDNEALLAPGDFHMISSISGRIQLSSLPAVNGVRPAADVTLQAVAPVWRDRLLAVVLTGMGVDARDGAKAVKAHGGCVIAQDRDTSAVWGMPGAIVEAGLADRVLPLDRIADAIAAWAAGGAAALRPGVPIPSTGGASRSATGAPGQRSYARL
jgi:two-component system chemotaxis response regulator CheB